MLKLFLCILCTNESYKKDFVIKFSTYHILENYSKDIIVLFICLIVFITYRVLKFVHIIQRDVLINSWVDTTSIFLIVPNVFINFHNYRI